MNNHLKPEYIKLFYKKRRTKNFTILFIVLFFVVLFFLITILRMKIGK